MPGENPTGAMDAGAGAVNTGFATDNLVAGGWGTGTAMGGFEMGAAGGSYFSGATIGSGGIDFAGTGTQAGGAVFNAGDAHAEMPQAAVVKADSAADANLIIGKDADGNVTHTWNKPLDASNNYQCAVFVDEAARNDPAGVAAQLQLAKSEAANGKDAFGNNIATDGKRLAFQAPQNVDALIGKPSSSDPADKGDKEGDDPEDQAPSGGGGGGGGGGNCDPPADDDDPKEEQAAKEEEAAAEKAAAEQAAASSKSLGDETKSQLDKNGGMSNANMANYAQGLWSGSMMSNLFSKYDKDGDGKLSPEEMAEMEKDPDYSKAQDELKNKIGGDPALADFKNKIGTAEGLTNLNQLQQAGANAQAADVSKVFNAQAQGAVSKLAVAQELQAAGLKPGDPLPKTAAEQKALFDGKIKSALDNLVNGKHVFSF